MEKILTEQTIVFKVRGVKQEIELAFMCDKAARLEVLKIFTKRGFVDLKLSEIKISKW